MLGSDRDDMIQAMALTAVPRAPLIARLLDSVAPEVNTISRGSALINSANFATCGFDSGGGFPAERVGIDVRVPELLTEIGSIASSTSGSSGVVAWQSR